MRMPKTGAWAAQLDFMGPRIRTSVWGWMALLVGGCLLAVQADELMRVRSEQAEAAETLRRLDRARHQAGVAGQAREGTGRSPRASRATAMATATAAARGKAQDTGALNAESTQRAAQVAQWLGFDWAAVWSRIETLASEDQVILTGFRLDLGTLASRAGVAPELQLQAYVLDDGAALQWLSHLGQGAQLTSRETLREPVTTSRGLYTQKVDLSVARE